MFDAQKFDRMHRQVTRRLLFSQAVEFPFLVNGGIMQRRQSSALCIAAQKRLIFFRRDMPVSQQCGKFIQYTSKRVMSPFLQAIRAAYASHTDLQLVQGR